MKNRLLSELFRPFQKGLDRLPRISLSEWADRHRILTSLSSSETGPWRTQRTPYLKGIMDALSDPETEKVVFMKGAQVGGTEVGNNWIGYIIDQTPGPLLVVHPTLEMASRWSRGRLRSLLEETPALKEKVKEPRSRDSGNTLYSKEFPGGQLVVTGANSATGLRSMPVQYLFLDEVDAYPQEVGREGDPLALAIARTRTFKKRKILMVSTPTIKGRSAIERAFDESDQRFYFVPCPFCGHAQTLVWGQIRWEKGDPQTVHYECCSCGARIEEQRKTDMLLQGAWRALKPEVKRTRGFHLSSLYSPWGWLSWQEIVASFLEAKDHPPRLKAWSNTILGETWVQKGEAPEWQRLFERALPYPRGTVPEKGLFLTAGVDVQKNRLELEVVAWGRNRTSWSVDYEVLPGNPYEGKVWRDLSQVLEKKFPHEKGGMLEIQKLAIDSGYASQEVYAWVRERGERQVMALKGVSSTRLSLGVPRSIDLTAHGQSQRFGVKVWPVGVDLLKEELYERLKLQKDEDGQDPPGSCFFPSYDPEYFKQLTAEELVTHTVKGYPRSEWRKTRDRNEALDCRLYARAAALALGIERFSETNWRELEENLQAEPTERPSRERRIYRSRWMETGQSRLSL